jgi:hypothetical protein
MPRLAAAGTTRGRAGWAAFDVGKVAGRRPGGIGGVLVQTLLEFVDLLLKLLNPCLQLARVFA